MHCRGSLTPAHVAPHLRGPNSWHRWLPLGARHASVGGPALAKVAVSEPDLDAAWVQTQWSTNPEAVLRRLVLALTAAETRRRKAEEQVTHDVIQQKVLVSTEMDLKMRANRQRQEEVIRYQVCVIGLCIGHRSSFPHHLCFHGW